MPRRLNARELERAAAAREGAPPAPASGDGEAIGDAAAPRARPPAERSRPPLPARTSQHDDPSGTAREGCGHTAGRAQCELQSTRIAVDKEAAIAKQLHETG
jgi:hypothetical protein